MRKITKGLIGIVCLLTSITAQAGWYYTLLDAVHYKHTVQHARARVQQILTSLQPYRQQDPNAQVTVIGNELADTPYIYHGGTGEGDWQPKSTTYVGGAAHIVQNPVYRFDGFDCQSFVEVVMALLHARSLTEFDSSILKIIYGAAGNPNGEIVRYYNRNHFVDGDFNPVNHTNGWLKDVTNTATLANYAATTTATITRQHWFSFQRRNLHDHIRVIDDNIGTAMVHRFNTVYSALKFPRFNKEEVTITYIPKMILALRQEDGSFEPNNELLDKIPTPALAEVVRDVKVWGRGRAKTILGSELNISHFGILYRQTFKKDDVIYQQIKCKMLTRYKKTCAVTPIICQQKTCNELMFMHATDAYPKGFYWYQQGDGNFLCTSVPPKNHTNFSYCNRVERLPFFKYVADHQFGVYWYMRDPSLLGFHFEKLTGFS